MQETITHLGYIGVLIGTFLEGETTILLAAIFAKLGYLKLKPAIFALAVAESAALAMANQHGDASKVFDALAVLSEESEWQSIIFKMKTSLAEAHSVSDFVRSLNLKRGVTGYSLHVVPVALYAWLRHPDEFRTALAAALDCGGDTDTVGAILGALSGAWSEKRNPN